MQRLLQMTHAQWAYRNATVHQEVKEGWTAAAHETIQETMEGFLLADPEQLLEKTLSPSVLSLCCSCIQSYQ
jgi:hypothetical protein